MKSIKEKAEEYSFIRQGIDPVGIQFREFNTNKQNGFEAGANYVLETIEKECKRVAQLCKSHVENPVDEEDKIDSWARLDEMEYMLKFIEQLKK